MIRKITDIITGGIIFNSSKAVEPLMIIIALLVLYSLPLSSQVITNDGAAIKIIPGTFINSKDAVNNAGVLSNDGNFNLSGSYTSTGNTTGNGIYSLGGSWTTNTGGIFVPGSSTVIFNGSDDQLITRTGGETFNNLIVENSGAQLLKRLKIQNNVTVLGTLTMSLGNIDAGTYLLYLSNPLASALNYTSTTNSRIFGKFERGISQAATYLFPLGTASFYNPLNLKTNDVPVAGSVLSQYFSLDPGNTGLPIPDPPVEIHDRYPDGYWSLTANNFFSSSDFSINLDGAGFADTIRDVTRVIKRTDGGSWTVDGTHRDAVGTVVNRENLTEDISTSGTQFALGRIRPLIISHPRDTIVCENTDPFFKVVASGAEKLKYTWYKEPGILIENGPHYSGARTATLTIIGAVLGDAGDYYCIVSDRYRNSVRSNNATLVVMKIPEAEVTPENQPDECSNIAFEDIVLNLNYWDPGTTFVWTRDNPDGITTTIPLTGSANTIGSVLSGIFVNRSDSPIKITFLVTPVGPDPTNCVGEPVSAFVVVNPTPRVIPVNALPVICSGESTSIRLTTPTTMTKGSITFDYSVAFEGLPGDITGDNAPGTAYPENVFNKIYTNNSDTILSVFYTITPRNNMLSCVYDSIRIPEVKVHPLPLQDMYISTPFTCAGGIDGVITAVLAKGSKPDVLTWFERPWAGDTTYTTTADSVLQPIRYAGKYNLDVKDSFGCSNKIEGLDVLGTSFRTNFYINDITGFGTTCNGVDDGQIWIWESGSSSTAKAPFEYWLVFNGEDTIRMGIIADKDIYTYENNLPAGDYKLIIKDANGCYNRSFPTGTITEPPPIAVTFAESDYNGFNITCRGYNDGFIKVTSVTGGNGGPYSYLWTTDGGNIPGPANTDRLDNIPAGTYYLETTDIRGCVRRDTIILNEPEGMTLDNSELSHSPDSVYNISCNGGNDGTIDLTISGGAKPYSYLWTDSASYSAITEDIKDLTAGTYVCKVTDSNGCELKIPPLSVYPAFTLTEPSAIFFHAITSTSADGSYNINCNDSTGWVDLNVTGGSGGSYVVTWSTEDGAGIIPGETDQPSLNAGTYHVNVKDANNCEKDTIIVLTQPDSLTASLVPTHITCQPAGFANGSIDLTAGGGIAPYGGWNWSNGAVTEDISGLTEGYYRITFTDANGCPHTDSVRVNLPDQITFMPLISDYNGYNVTCNGKSDGWINISMNSGLAPFIYEWGKTEGGFSGSGESVTGLSSGHYTLKVTDANMCTTTDILEIREPGVFGINILKSSSIAGGYNINCAGDSTGSAEIETVNQAGSVTYLWSDGATTAVRNNIPQGDYSVYVEDANGCWIDSLFTMTAPDSMKLSFNVIQPWCPDKPDGEIHLTVTGGVIGTDYSYIWSDGSDDRDITEIVEGNFVVMVTDLNGCILMDSVYVEPQHETCLIIPNAFSPNGDLINDLWNIGLIELYPEAEIKIFNRWGGTVWRSEKGYPHPWDGRSNGSLLPIDSYHYIINLGPKRKPVIGNVTIVR